MSAAVVNSSAHEARSFLVNGTYWRARCLTCTWKSGVYSNRTHADHAADNHAEVTGNGEWIAS